MPESNVDSDDSRWPAMFRRAQEALFVLNRLGRIVFANAAWENLTKATLDDARTLTCTTRSTGHALAGLGRALAPTAEANAGQTVSVRRPPPGRDAGPPWWDIDFVPVMGESGPLGMVGRLRETLPHPQAPKALLPASWGLRRGQKLALYSFSRWESALPAMHRAVAQARLVAATGCSAALIGPHGVGKQTLARTIHAASPRRELPCICLLCDRLPADAVMAALDRPESFGVVYLHDPGALPRDVQAQLAGALAARAQLLIGCPADPIADVKSGRLTEELWAAASIVAIHLPPLNERLADLPTLAASFLRDAGDKSLAAEAQDLLRTYAWPGNLDEMQTVLSVASARAAAQQIDAADLPHFIAAENPEPRPQAALPPLDGLLEEVEARMIRLALARAGGNKTKAAELLGVWRPRLIRRIEALGIANPEG